MLQWIIYLWDISEKIKDEKTEKYSTTVHLLPFDKCGLLNMDNK